MTEKLPPVPPDRRRTSRRKILDLLAREGPLSAAEISSLAGVREKDVAGHLEHLRRSLSRERRSLVVIPAECRQCGFLFRKRQRLSAPGRCPVCRSEAIADPRFVLKEG